MPFNEFFRRQAALSADRPHFGDFDPVSGYAEGLTGLDRIHDRR
ncbi:hypothetical protein IFM12276_01660 [Nocardia sputorum]|uniref:Uncharacterized protein n=1 Tax=Nocardia sputorum TaxID=2984338 RepID=A0ABM8CQG5_9NOCA|nr:hypothetical protein IFM12276_01660 [Nocardia sputorum]